MLFCIEIGCCIAIPVISRTDIFIEKIFYNKKKIFSHLTLVKSISVIQSLSVSWCSESFMKVQIIIWRSCQKVENSVLLWGLRVDQIWCQWKNEELHNDFYVEWNPTILRRILRGGYLLLLYFQRWVKRNSVLTSILTP